MQYTSSSTILWIPSVMPRTVLSRFSTSALLAALNPLFFARFATIADKLYHTPPQVSSHKLSP